MPATTTITRGNVQTVLTAIADRPPADLTDRLLIAGLELRAWAKEMGGWEAPCWRQLDSVLSDAGYAEDP